MRSPKPYEPLRFVPSTWKIFADEQPVPTLRKMQLLVDIRDRFNQPTAISSAEEAQPTWLQELRDLVALCRSHLLVGFAVAQMAEPGLIYRFKRAKNPPTGAVPSNNFAIKS